MYVRNCLIAQRIVGNTGCGVLIHIVHHFERWRHDRGVQRLSGTAKHD